MKRGTPEHFKTMRLATLLHCDRADALGILEALCNHFAPRSAPQGNVGRCMNAEIVTGCYSTRDPDTVVEALVKSGWLDEHPEYRLLIHDWKDHADESVRKWLIRNKLPWLTMSGPCRVGVRTTSRQRRDGVRPPRAGNGTGNGLEVLGSEGNRKVRKGKGSLGEMPDPYPLSEKAQRFAEAGGLDAAQEFAAFKDKARAKGWKYANWDAGFRTWCRNEVQFAAERAERRR